MRRRAVFSFLPSFFNNSTTPSSTTTSLSSPYPLHHTFFISNAKCQLNHLCFRLQKQPFSLSPLAFTPIFSIPHHYGVSSSNYQASRSYARDRRKQYNLFGSRKSDDKDSKKAWDEEANDDDDCLWTGSEDESKDEKDTSKGRSGFGKELRRIRKQAKEHSDQIDADDSDELRSIWSDSDEEKTLWTGDEGDSDADIPTEAHPNEASDKYIDKLFEFEEKPKYRTISELLKAENEPEELSPGKQARKLAVENALKKLKKGPDGRYINVWEVMSDLDILIGAFENIVSGPEYEELRQGGPKRLNMQFFKDIQAKMRDPNYKFSPELKLKPRSKLVPRKKWQKAQSRRRKAQKR